LWPFWETQTYFAVISLRRHDLPPSHRHVTITVTTIWRRQHDDITTSPPLPTTALGLRHCHVTTTTTINNNNLDNDDDPMVPR
jgi:hypothetical protein